MSEVAFGSVTPILFVRDVTASARFFEEKLGFEIGFLYGSPPFYGAVVRGGACLHLRFVSRPNFAELAAREPSLIVATISVSDVRPLFREFADRGVAISQAPTRQPWGGTDLHVQDPDGNVISFVSDG